MGELRLRVASAASVLHVAKTDDDWRVLTDDRVDATGCEPGLGPPRNRFSSVMRNVTALSHRQPEDLLRAAIVLLALVPPVHVLLWWLRAQCRGYWFGLAYFPVAGALCAVAFLSRLPSPIRRTGLLGAAAAISVGWHVLPAQTIGQATGELGGSWFTFPLAQYLIALDAPVLALSLKRQRPALIARLLAFAFALPYFRGPYMLIRAWPGEGFPAPEHIRICELLGSSTACWVAIALVWGARTRRTDILVVAGTVLTFMLLTHGWYSISRYVS